jgi:hypothetical protein
VLAVKWMTIRALAHARHMSTTAVRAALDAMESRGAKVRTRKAGGVLQVDLPDFDLKRAAAMSPRRLQGEQTRRALRGSSTEPVDPVFLKEQAKKVRYEAELKRLELERQLGKLIDAEALKQAALDCGTIQAAQIDRITMHAESLYAAGRRGEAAVRAALREIARDLKKSTGEALAGAVAPCTDDDGADDGE